MRTSISKDELHQTHIQYVRFPFNKLFWGSSCINAVFKYTSPQYPLALLTKK